MKHYLVEFAKKIIIWGACSLLLLSCEPAPTSAIYDEDELKQDPQTLTRAIYSATFQLDPHFVSVNADAAPLRDLYVGLTRYNVKGDIVPAIAQEWFSEDGKEWLFILNEQARWSNGEPVTAQDFVKSWQRLAHLENRSALSHYLRYLDLVNVNEVLDGKKAPNELGIQALNDFALKITLSHSNYQLPKMLAHIALLPTYQGKAVSGNDVITNGDYRLVQRDKKKLTLQANDPSLWFKNVEYHLIETIQNTRRFDVVENPLKSSQQHVYYLPRLCSYFYEFNFHDPHLKKKEVRQAIRTMLNSNPVHSLLGRANRFMLPDVLNIQPIRHYQTLSSEQLLITAQITSSQPLRLKLHYNESEEHYQIATHLARTLAQSDLFRVELINVDDETLLKLRQTQQFQLLRSGWCSDYSDPLPFLLPFHSKSPDNRSGYHNAYVDSQLERLQKEALTDEERFLLLQSIVQHLDNDVAVLPILHYQRRIMLNPSIRGIDFNNQSEIIYSKDLYRELSIGNIDESTYRTAIR